MNVRELINLLQKCDPLADVVISPSVTDVETVEEVPANEWLGAYVVIR